MSAQGKRRRVWVNEYDADDEGPGGLGDLAWQTRAAALASISSDGRAVAFIERLPGDVVLSREESERVRQFVLGSESRSVSTAEDEVLALLRGRR